MAEAVKVIVRCRPMNSRERNLGCEEVVSTTSQTQCTIVNPDAPGDPLKDFTFDGAYFTESTTEQIYNDVCFDLVENVLEGYNGTVFAYGQTGCGKSFSMQGIPDPVTQRGIIPRAFDHIFEAVAIAKNKRFLVYASYLEIYNEQVRDLLSKDAKKQLDLKEHPEKGVYVHGLSMNEVRNVEECQLLMAKGWNNRSVGATLMNADSSRSHSIFTINIEIMDEVAVGAGGGSGDTGEHFVASKLNLVDLAGSERQSKTGASGDRLKEATKINLSLSALGNVISALVDGKSKHIPYRDSKLTRLLQDSLGGNTKTLMVACLSPAADNYDETLSTLRYANRAKNIKNKPKINEDPKDALLRQYQEEITQLKAMLEGKPLPLPLADKKSPEHSSDRSEVEKEKEQIKREYEAHLRRMEQQMSDLSRAKEMVEHELTTLKLKSNQRHASNCNNGKGQLKEENYVSVAYDEDNIGGEMSAEFKGNEIDDDDGYEHGGQKGKDNDEELYNEFDDDIGDEAEEEECGCVDGNYLTVNDRGDASAFKKSPELRRKNARPKSSAPSLISITETEAEVSPRQSKRATAGGNRNGGSSNSLQNNQITTAGERVAEFSVEEQQATKSQSGGEGSDSRSDPTANCDKFQSNYENGAEGEGKENNVKRMQQPLTAEQEAAMKRLAELEAMFSKKFIKGGDQGALSASSGGNGNQGVLRNTSGESEQREGLQEKRLKRKKQQEEKRRKALREAAESENMDTVVQVYDNVMTEIHDRQLKEEKLKRKLQAAEIEIRDLTSEFEDERRDYLETIRSQTKQMQLVESILEKVQPLIQRDCNYFNMRKVKEDAKYDIDGQCWRLPDVQLIKTNLPSLGQDASNGLKTSSTFSGPFNTKLQRGNTMTQSTLIRADHQLDSSSHGMKLLDDSGPQDDVFQNYMKPKRAQKILEQGAATRSLHDGTNSNGNLQYHNGGNGQARFSNHLLSQQQQQPNPGGNDHPFNPGTLRNSHQLLDQSFSSPTSGSGAAAASGIGSQSVASPNSQFEIPNPKNVRLEKLDLNAERPYSKTKKKKKEKTFIS